MWIYCNEIKYALNLDNAVCFKIDRADFGKYIEIKNVKDYIVSAYMNGESWFICSVDTEEEAVDFIKKLTVGQSGGAVFNTSGEYI